MTDLESNGETVTDTMTETPAMTGITEKRSEPRQRVFKGGVISFDGTGVDCTVRNLSSNGAALDVVNVVQLPPSFKLMIETENLLRECRLVWNAGRRVGVAFE